VPAANDAYDVQVSDVFAGADSSDLQLGNVRLSARHLCQPHQPGLCPATSAAFVVISNSYSSVCLLLISM